MTKFNLEDIKKLIFLQLNDGMSARFDSKIASIGVIYKIFAWIKSWESHLSKDTKNIKINWIDE